MKAKSKHSMRPAPKTQAAAWKRLAEHAERYGLGPSAVAPLRAEARVARAEHRNPAGPSLSAGDKKVLRAFVNQQAADNKKFQTDGHTVEGLWLGGRNIAHWSDDGIVLSEPSGLTSQMVTRAIKKIAGPIAKYNWERAKKNPSSGSKQRKRRVREFNAQHYPRAGGEHAAALTLAGEARTKLGRAKMARNSPGLLPARAVEAWERGRWQARMQDVRALARPVLPNPALSDGDKKILRAFVNQQAADNKKFQTDGKVLDGLWMGGRDLARWVNGRIVLAAPVGLTSQMVTRAVKKIAGPIAKYDYELAKKNPSSGAKQRARGTRSFGTARGRIAREVVTGDEYTHHVKRATQERWHGAAAKKEHAKHLDRAARHRPLLPNPAKPLHAGYVAILGGDTIVGAGKTRTQALVEPREYGGGTLEPGIKVYPADAGILAAIRKDLDIPRSHWTIRDGAVVAVAKHNPATCRTCKPVRKNPFGFTFGGPKAAPAPAKHSLTFATPTGDPQQVSAFDIAPDGRVKVLGRPADSSVMIKQFDAARASREYDRVAWKVQDHDMGRWLGQQSKATVNPRRRRK